MLPRSARTALRKRGVRLFTPTRTAVNSWVTFESAGYNLPHPNKLHTGGEDAYFVECGNSNNGAYSVLCVADGVAQWADVGVDPGHFPRVVVNGVRQQVQHEPPFPPPSTETHTRYSSSSDFGTSVSASNSATPPSTPTPTPTPASTSSTFLSSPLDLLRAGYAAALEEQPMVGSCTLCCVSLSCSLEPGARPRLRAANLGDSGFVVIRDGGILFKSVFQEYEFGFPYQLGIGTDEHPAKNTPVEKADVLSFDVRPHDWIVVGSDGLWDNVSNDEILDIYSAMSNSSARSRSNTDLSSQFAIALGDAAFANSTQGRDDTPYSLRASETFSQIFRGGKMDDITVLTARVVPLQ